jgi:hypothetical protein
MRCNYIHYMMLDFITSSLHPACNGCNYMRLHDHYMQNKMLMRRAAQLSDQPQRHRAAGPSGQWTDGADTYQWTSRPRAPGARSWSHEPPLLGSDSDSADWSLHTAGPDNPDRATRLHLLGPAAIGSGPGRRRRSGVGQSGMDRAEGGDYS